MGADFLYKVYMAVLIFSIIMGIYRYGRMDNGGSVVFWLLIITTISEICSTISYRLHFGKNPVYHIDCVIESILITTFFLVNGNSKNKRHYIIVTIVLWPILGILNCLFFQPIKKLDTNVILLENCWTISMALYALYKILLDDSITSVMRSPAFWFTVLFLILSSGTFFFWAYLVVSDRKGVYLNATQEIQAMVNILVYAGMGAVFLLYPKNQVDGSK